ncbi:MAG TPA: NAD-dependent epimerase/dehydratase family protein [Bacteroidales bacterium]|nr:NAD-dependent epimerase/dehydratase family protein [Bacteroidales bacterium]
MKIFLTGGSGFIGSRLTERLINEDHGVTLLLRDPGKDLWFDRNKVRIVTGDIFDTGILAKEMKGCEVVFHLAAYTKPWSKDPELPYRVNVTGTINVLSAAIEAGVKRVVMTSSCGTFGYSYNGSVVNELTVPENPLCTVYERTKAEAEQKALGFCSRGIDVIIVNPSRLYGPGVLTSGNSLTRIIRGYVRGTWRIIPGKGTAVGNYVFIDDVVDGHIKAAIRGVTGEKYILGGENLSFSALFKIIGEESGRKRRMIRFPLAAIRDIIRLIRLGSRFLGISPPITEEWIDKYMKDTVISSDKAVSVLGYKITPFRQGVRKTVEWLMTNHR